jgi:hypothetical protein
LQLGRQGAKVITDLFGRLDQGKHNTCTEHNRWRFSLAVLAQVRSQFTASTDNTHTLALSPTTIQWRFWALEAVGARWATSSSAYVSLAMIRSSNSCTDRGVTRA